MNLDLPGPVRLGDIAAQLPVVSPADYTVFCLLLVPAVLVASAWAMQHGPLDLAVAGLFFDDGSGGFPWRHSTWLEVLGHQAARALPIVIGALALAAAAAGAALPGLSPWRRILFALGGAMILGPLLIDALRGRTATPSPGEYTR